MEDLTHGNEVALGYDTSPSVQGQLHLRDLLVDVFHEPSLLVAVNQGRDEKCHETWERAGYEENEG
jgi:hypothetical protein